MNFFVDNLPYILAGISVGGQYALIAIGYTMVYGILRLINFAHGDMFMVAGLVMVYLAASMPIYIAIPVVIIFPKNSVIFEIVSSKKVQILFGSSANHLSISLINSGTVIVTKFHKSMPNFVIYPIASPMMYPSLYGN